MQDEVDEDGSVAATLGVVRRERGAFTTEEVATLEAISKIINFTVQIRRGCRACNGIYARLDLFVERGTRDVPPLDPRQYGVNSLAQPRRRRATNHVQIGPLPDTTRLRPSSIDGRTRFEASRSVRRRSRSWRSPDTSARGPFIGFSFPSARSSLPRARSSRLAFASRSAATIDPAYDVDSSSVEPLSKSMGGNSLRASMLETNEIQSDLDAISWRATHVIAKSKCNVQGYVFLAFDDVGWRIIEVSWGALAILLLALFAGAVDRFFVAAADADEIVFEATLDLDRSSAIKFYSLYRSRRPKNVAVAWILTVVLGPLGAFGYMEQWGKFAAALFTLNGLGAWWIESLYSVPQLVLMDNRRSAKWALEQLPFALQLEARHGI